MVLDSCVHITQGDVDRANVEALPWTSAADRPLWEAAKFVRARLGTNGLRQLPVLPDSYKPAERNSLTMRHAGPLTRAVPRFDTNDNAWHRAFGEATGDFVFGHRHESAVKHLDGSVLICTGSVGGPFDGDPRAAYVVLDLAADHLDPVHRRIDYDRDPTALALESLGPFGAWIAGGIRRGERASAPWTKPPARS